jgi:hypothetical protein
VDITTPTRWSGILDPWDEAPPADEITQTYELRKDLYGNGYRPVPIFSPHVRVKNPGKQPVGDDWANEARYDPPKSIVEQPSYDALNTGILADGLRAIDIDIDDSGIARQVHHLAMSLLGDQPLIRTRAGSPRRLLIYRAAEGQPPKRHKVGRSGKVEVLGRGQQFAAFGIHAESGSRLNWNHGSPSCYHRDELPEVTEAEITAFLEAIAPIIGAIPARVPDGPEPCRSHSPAAFTSAEERDVSAALKMISDQGGDYDHWIRVGHAIHAATEGSAEGLALFDQWSQKCASKYDGEEVQQTWNSFKPERIGVGTLFKLAQDADPNWRAPSWDADPLLDAALAKFQSNTTRGQDDVILGATKQFTASPLWTLNLRKIEPRRWLYGRQLLRGMVTVLGGTGGVGKTSYVIAVGLSVAAGRSLLAHHPGEESHIVHKPGGVWYYNLEDPVDEMVRRISAEVAHRNINVRSLWDSFYVDSGRDKPLTVATRDRHGNVLRLPVVDALVHELREKEIVLLIVDPFANSHEVGESDNDDMKVVVDQWRQVAHRADCAVWLIHHFRKGGQAGDAESFRGASALQNGARVMETITTMSSDDAEAIGVPPAERRDYVRLENAKVNLSRAPSEAEWYKFVGVSLNNGNDEYPQGDIIGVLDRWVPLPPLHGKSWPQVSGALDELDAGTGDREFYSSAPQATRWAGHVLMRRFGMNDQQAVEQLKEWLADGVLFKDTYTSPSRNHGKAQRVRVDADGKARLKATMDADQSHPPTVSGS